MRNLHLSVAVLIGALALTGCSRNPVAPQVVVPAEPAATLGRGVQTQDPEAPQAGEAGLVGTIHVEAMGAGVVSVGRWTLTIHKNSHLDAAMVTLTVPDPQSMEVQIEVTPASANLFQVPIELVANLSDQTGLIMNEHTIYWWNGDWTADEAATAQAGSMLLKSKSTQLSSAKVGSFVTVKGGKKN